jgi:carboxyl-terminal processing protease
MALACATALPAQDKWRQQAVTLKRVIEKHHISPRPVNDSFSAGLYNDLLQELDENKLFFTQAEITQLAAYQFKLDDELNGASWNFLPLLTKLYQQQLQKMQTWLSQQNKPFEFETAEIYTVPGKETPFAATEAELQKRWLQYLKYDVLGNLAEMARNEKEEKGRYDKKTILLREPALRQKAIAALNRVAQAPVQAPGGMDAFMGELFCEKLAASFDPHTNYFNLGKQQRFQADLSGQAIVFGFSLGDNDNQEVMIERLQPGSPAFKSGALHKGDVLQKMQWEENAPVDLSGSTAREVSDLLSGHENERLTLIVKKKDGTVKTVSLRREKIATEDGLVKSFIINGAKKTGFITLPDFYTSYNEADEAGCAADMATEIVKLKKEGIEGLVLDLRYNGGGSMGEALAMAGIFIEEGPLMLYRQKEGKVITMKDPNRGTIFDGPLVVLINGASASASELLAATLQDYNRAVIVGGRSFGKATSQLFYAIDTVRNYQNPMEAKPEFGFVKITGGKLYRLNGGVAQHRGVRPDVVLPDAFSAMGYYESDMPHSLLPDTVPKNNYYKPLPALPVALLAEKSRQRVAADSGFTLINKAVSLLQQLKQRKNTPIPLKWDAYEKFYQQQVPAADISGTSKAATGLPVAVTRYEAERLKVNKDLDEMYNDWMKRVGTDIYIKEACTIIANLLNK